MKKYFAYELKKNAFVIGFLALICVIVYLTPILSTQADDLVISDAELWFSSVIGGVLATIVPVSMLSYKMKRRSVDLYYSLPLSHGGVLAVKYLVGLIALYVPYTLSYWLGAFVVMAKTASATFDFFPVYYLPHYFASLLPLFMMYAISAFAFTRANTNLDGIVFVIFWALAAFCVAQALQSPTFRTEPVVINGLYEYQTVYPECFIYFFPLDFTTSRFQYLLTGDAITLMPAYTVNAALGIAFTSLLAIGSTAGIFLLEKGAKAENVEQISESPFGYRVMIPLFTASLLATLEINNDLEFCIFFVFIVIGAFAVTILYKRTIKIGKKQAIVYGCSVALGLLLFFLFHIN